MIKGFLFMLKRMGKKGMLGKRFLDKHAYKEEEELRKELLKKLIKIKEEKRGKKLDKFRNKLESRRRYGDFRGSEHFEKTINVVNNIQEHIQDPGEKREKLRREIEELEKEVRELEGRKVAEYAKKGVVGGVKAAGWMLKTAGRAAVGGGRELTKNWNPNFFIILAIIIYLLDRDYFGLATSFNGIRVEQISWSVLRSVLTNWEKIFLNSVVLVSIAFYWVTFSTSWKDLVSFSVMAMMTSLIISFGATGSIWHLILVYFLYLGFIGPVITAQSGSRSRAHYLMALFLFIDYFGYGIVDIYFFNGKANLLTNRFIYPIWFYFTAFYSFRVKTTTFTKVVVFLVIAVNIFALAQGYYQVRGAVETDIGEEVTQAESFLDKAKERFEQEIGRVKRKVQQQMEFATGGYYEGQVEENENIPLGVYFEDTKASVTEFYEDEPVEVWGDLLVRTLDRDTPVTVNVGCEYEEEHMPANSVMPKEGFTIYTMEEEVIECRFDAGAIPKGTRKIRLTADFNFKTMAYLKSYMMDKETLRSMRKDEIDVFDYYGIRDKNPIAIFTNGPVKIGMETNDPPMGLYENSTPYLGITIENQWSGNIKNINEMIVQIPRGMEFFKNCDEKFDVVTEGVTDPNYNVYALNDRGKRYFKMPIEKERYRSLRCLMQIKDKNRVLGDVPLTTKYFRTTISYDYELEQDVSVNIKQVPRLEYYVIGGTCSMGNNYELISEKIGESVSVLKNCKQYLGNFSRYRNMVPNKNDIDLLMVLSVAQKESECRALDAGGIMQIDEDGKKKDYSNIKPEDVSGCEPGEDCKVVVQISEGVAELYVRYDAVKNKKCGENENKDCGFDNLKLLKFALLSYNRGGSVAFEAMNYHFGGMPLYDAMKYGCEAFKIYEGETDRSDYSLCTGRNPKKNDVRAYGAEYPGAVFEIYKQACKDIGGAYNEESIT